MKRKVIEQMNSVGWGRVTLVHLNLVALCLIGCLRHVALAQESEPRYVISKEGRQYQVEPLESFERRLEARRKMVRADDRSALTSQTLNQAATPDFVSLAQYQTPFRFTAGIYGNPNERGQGNRGTCWAFAGAAALEAAYMRKYQLSLDLSEQYIFHMSKAMELHSGTPENNTSLTGFQGSSDVVAHMSRYAVPEERFAPYMSDAQMNQLLASLNLSNIVNNPTQLGYDTFEFSEQHIPTAARWNAKYYVTGYGRIPDPTDLSSLERTLAENHEIVADFDLRWMFNASKNVYEYDPNSSGGGHVMLLIGYNRSDQVFMAKNSWGETDFIRMTYDFVKKNIKGGFYIKDVADPQAPPQKKARFLGSWDFDDAPSNPLSNNIRVTGTLVIRRFTYVNGTEPFPMKLGSLYPSNGGGPFDVTGYYTDYGEGIVLDIHTNPGAPAEYLRFTYPLGFWRYVDRNYAGTQVGSIEQPFTSFFDGVNSVPRKGTVFVQPGHYSAVGIYNKPMKIKAPQGGVTLGN